MYLIRVLISTPAILSAQPHSLKKSIPRRKIKLELMAYLLRLLYILSPHEVQDLYDIFYKNSYSLCFYITLNLMQALVSHYHHHPCPSKAPNSSTLPFGIYGPHRGKNKTFLSNLLIIFLLEKMVS